MNWLNSLSYTNPKLAARMLHTALILTIFGGMVSMSDSASPTKRLKTNLPNTRVLSVSTSKPATPTISPIALPLQNTSLSGSTDDPKALARSMSARKFGDQYWPDLHNLWIKESGWNPNARNGSSGACGIPQALPCSKIGDHTTLGQITWGLDYIAGRYGNPRRAWQHWQTHHWY